MYNSPLLYSIWAPTCFAPPSLAAWRHVHQQSTAWPADVTQLSPSSVAFVIPRYGLEQHRGTRAARERFAPPHPGATPWSPHCPYACTPTSGGYLSDAPLRTPSASAPTLTTSSGVSRRCRADTARPALPRWPHHDRRKVTQFPRSVRDVFARPEHPSCARSSPQHGVSPQALLRDVARWALAVASHAASAPLERTVPAFFSE